MPYSRAARLRAFAGALVLFAFSIAWAQAPKPLTPVQFGLTDLGNVNALPLVYAVSAGFIKEEGIDLQFVRFQSGGEIVRAAVGGHIDFAPLSMEGIISARAAKSDLKAFAKMNDLSGLIVLVRNDRKDQIKTFKDMKGAKIGVSGLGGGTHRLLQVGLKKAGIPESDVTFVAVGTGATAVAAVKAGQIDVLSTADPAATVAVNENLATIIWDGRKLKDNVDLYGSPYPVLTIGAARSTLDKKPDVARGFARAIQRSLTAIKEKPPEQIAAVILPEYKGKDEALYVQMVRASKDMYGASAAFDNAAVETVVQTMSTFEKMVREANVKASDVYTNEFVAK
jgi:NitT/TauT family transport system substrate-binding protein